MTEEPEMQELYKTTLEKMVGDPNPSTFMQGYMVLSTIEKILGMKNMRTEIQINIVDGAGKT